MSRIIEFNFRVAIVVTICGALLIFLMIMNEYPESLSHLAGYEIQTMLWPIVTSILTLMLWYGFYKNGGGHGIAFGMGWFMLIPAFSAEISELINGEFFNSNEKLFLYYIGVSHILYGLQNWQEIASLLNQDAN